MKTMPLMALTLLSAASVHADFSYTQTRRTTGGSMAGMMGNNGSSTTRVLLKGQKMKVDSGAVSTIVDLDAQTVTTIDTARKTYNVKSLSDPVAAAGELNATIDVKETGQKRNINGFNSSELVMTMEMDAPVREAGKMHMEMDMWLSPDVPGAKDLRDFYQKNGAKFPWRALAGQGNPQMASAMAELQKKMASMNGVPVQQIIRLKVPASSLPPSMTGAAPAGPNAAQMQQMQAGMDKARATLEAMAAQGGPAAEIAKQQLARMGGGGGMAAGMPGMPGMAPRGGAASGNMLEMTLDSGDFSNATIPDSAFAIPDGFQKN